MNPKSGVKPFTWLLVTSTSGWIPMDNILCIAYPKSGNGEGQLRCHHEQFGTDHELVEVGQSKQAWLYQPQMFCAAVCSLALAQLPEYIWSHVTMTFISVVHSVINLGPTSCWRRTSGKDSEVHQGWMFMTRIRMNWLCS
jgi:hypothetical protein